MILPATEVDYHRYRYSHVLHNHFSFEAMSELRIAPIRNATNIRGQSFLVPVVSNEVRLIDCIWFIAD